MAEWLISLEGTNSGRTLALILAVAAAVLHAVFGALQKGRHDPWLSRGAIDASYFLMALPVALFVVPWPEPHIWLLFAGVMAIHFVYKILQVMSYDRGAYTVVYPVMRGTGPLVTVIAAGLVFQETFNGVQWGGVILLTAAIFSLAAINLRDTPVGRQRLAAGLVLAFLTGIMVATYTTFDAYVIRQASNPFTVVFWFYVVDGILFPFIALRHYLRLEKKPPLPGLTLRGIIGALVAFGSFSSIMIATLLDKVGEAAVLRETSVVFAALIGWIFLKEQVGPLRALLMAVIAGGAVLVEFGG
ncbi:MAG: EamA family transporter [Rhodobacteraceae bacterium]|nr:EamA family transporter [Paracoccaceae bacterium]